MSSVEEKSTPTRVLHVGTRDRVETRADVERVTHSSTALDRAETVDCMVCEHAPPKRDALGLLEEIRGRDRNLPVLVVTDDESVIRDALAAGATDCVRPGSRVLLEHRVESAL
ncbi:hypothetical protein [Haladaptatus sp. NG-WS-4]